jgi:hypothetical protein
MNKDGVMDLSRKQLCLLTLHPPQYCYGGRAALSSLGEAREKSGTVRGCVLAVWVHLDNVLQFQVGQ